MQRVQGGVLCAEGASPDPPVTPTAEDAPTPGVPAPDGPSTPCTTNDDCTDAAMPYCNAGVNSTCTSLLPDGSDCSDTSECQRGCLDDTKVCGALSAGATCSKDIECDSGSCQVSATYSLHTC